MDELLQSHYGVFAPLHNIIMPCITCINDLLFCPSGIKNADPGSGLVSTVYIFSHSERLIKLSDTIFTLISYSCIDYQH